MDNFSRAPHPLLTSSTLYVADVTKRVKWHHLVEAFQTCGTVRSGGKSYVAGSRKTWAVMFSDIRHAEIALATLQGTLLPGLNPFFVLKLSHSPRLESAVPNHRLFPQFVQFDSPNHPVQDFTAQQAFPHFRQAGPIVSIRVGVDINETHRTCVVEYWFEEHANHARLNARTPHSQTENIREVIPPFCLRTYDPCSLYCGELAATFSTEDFYLYLSKFGEIVDARMLRCGVPASYGFVSFRTREQAAVALIAMRGRAIGGSTIKIRYYEPENQGLFRTPLSGRANPAPNFTPNATASQHDYLPNESAPSATHSESAPTQAAAERQRQQEEALRRPQEAEQAATAKRQQRAEALRLRQNAGDAVDSARQAMECARSVHDAAEATLAAATNGHAAARNTWMKAGEAVAVAERALGEAKIRAAEASRLVTSAVQGVAQAKSHKLDAWNHLFAMQEGRRHAEQEQAQVHRDTQEILDETEEMAREDQRQEELAESIRKMRELREQEEADRREKEERAQKERQAEELRQQVEQAERERKAREEAERLAREKREREERETKRREAYFAAAAAERARCSHRDAFWCNISGKPLWTKERALNRFMAVGVEFDQTKFCDAQPLTFESVPWPMLRSPPLLGVEDVKWKTVERFFSAAKLMLGEGEYKMMVEKAHRRFHPDKWKARGLLKTVLNEDLRKELERAGNVVAQAITPLWLASKWR